VPPALPAAALAVTPEMRMVTEVARRGEGALPATAQRFAVEVIRRAGELLPHRLLRLATAEMPTGKGFGR
jgi:hypothetical protein